MKKEITIVEDDQDIREICEYLFLSEGYKVNSYRSATDFRNSTSSPDLFLLDIMLPDGNGVDLCKDLKSAAATAGVPIIMMSAHMDQPTVKQSCNADDFLSKPFNLQRLLDRCTELIGNSASSSSPHII